MISKYQVCYTTVVYIIVYYWLFIFIVISICNKTVLKVFKSIFEKIVIINFSKFVNEY